MQSCWHAANKQGEAFDMVVKKIDANKMNYGQLEKAVHDSLFGGSPAVVVSGNGEVAIFVREGDEIRTIDNEVLVVTEEENETDDQ